jgi:hypothetical protein
MESTTSSLLSYSFSVHFIISTPRSSVFSIFSRFFRCLAYCSFLVLVTLVLNKVPTVSLNLLSVRKCIPFQPSDGEREGVYLATFQLPRLTRMCCRCQMTETWVAALVQWCWQENWTARRETWSSAILSTANSTRTLLWVATWGTA